MSYLTNIPSFEEMGEKYEDIYVELDMVAQKKKLKDQILSNGKEILDIGCNHGTQLIPYYNK
jgi:cyclopropane fatty-acyl-phospholipid synthase-like methyltransferase